MAAETDPVRGHSSEKATQRLDRERLDRIRRFASAPPGEASRHLYELDSSWDIERRLEANAAITMLLSTVLAATHSKRWLLLSALVPGFLLQHAVQGWCPPIEVFRRLGARSRNEIDASARRSTLSAATSTTCRMQRVRRRRHTGRSRPREGADALLAGVVRGSARIQRRTKRTHAVAIADLADPAGIGGLARQ